MPISTALIPSEQDDEEEKKSDNGTTNRMPPPVVPRRANVTLQSWQSVTSGSENYGDNNKHARSCSMDSLESSGSSSSSGGSNTSNLRGSDHNIGEYISTRLVTKNPKLPPHNPLQFVKVQSPLYIKAEQQIKLTKEVKISREALKEGEEEWQSNLDNWKSRRRKVTEKVIQRAEEMRQIEAEEQLKHEQNLFQQRKIKKFSEIVERRSSRSYNLDLYIGQGNDSGLGGTPEPDDVLDSHSSILRSDTSEGMTSEAESIDSDSHKSDQALEKEVPVVPQKPKSWIKNTLVSNTCQKSSANNFLTEITDNTFCSYENVSSTEQSDIEGHACDNETISSEEDTSFGDSLKLESDLENPDEPVDTVQNEHLRERNIYKVEETHEKSFTSVSNFEKEMNYREEKIILSSQSKVPGQILFFKLCIKPGDNKGFGFSIKGGKDLGYTPYIENISQDGSAYLVGLKEGDKILSLNSELASTHSHASLLFTIKQAVYTGNLSIEVSRDKHDDIKIENLKLKSTNKKSSFAEKLALFSAGASSNSDTAKSQSSNKTNLKKSLVLRRRSAFENSQLEKTTNRRSSCLFEETPNVHHDVEKRLSFGLTMQSCPKKKDPPPPVPLKPKLKAKQFSNIESTNINECDNHLTQTNYNGAIFKTLLSFDLISNQPIAEALMPSADVLKHEKSEIKVDSERKSDEFSSEENKIVEAPEISSPLIISEPELNFTNIRVLSISDKAKKLVYQKTFDTEDTDLNPMIFNDYTEKEIESTFSDSHVLDLNCTKLLENSSTISEKTNCDYSESRGTIIKQSLDDIFSEDIDKCAKIDIKQNEQELPIDFNDSFVENFQNNLDLNLSACNETGGVQTEIPSSPDYETKQQTHNIDLEKADELLNYKLHNAQFIEENIDSIEADIATDISIDASPLCLPLEKTEEEDVISASTTTSSDTPDTETVIETLPTNLSPLPNDESNGEDLIKDQNCQDQPIDALTCHSSHDTENSTLKSVDESNAQNFSYDVLDSVKPSDNLNLNSDIDYFAETNDVFIDDQDEEYHQELNESMDQITSLDVIDEMEHRLMQQLELQDKNYEELDANLALQLENDINQEWMYYTESDLFDDLTPRNREPPSEPPPPPPIEPEISEEQVSPFTRNNSTKRIKKELWRRRSDFLGLDISESIDVDNIIPPPPGLEEILKLEHEQNQWLEKRLSLVEAESITDSSFVDSQDLVQSEYSSNYLLNKDDSKFDLVTETETWKEIYEENLYDPYDSSSTSELPVQIPEENIKAKESPQHKAKQNIYSLGAAPKAKIMDSNKWITEKIAPIAKKTEPLIRQTSYDQNYWIAQDADRKRSHQSDILNRRYSMTSETTTYPDVTIRTWGDRENEFQRQRPHSALWNSPSNRRNSFDPETSLKQDMQLTHTFDEAELECDTDVLESEVHKCSCCGKGLCEGSAMGIEALKLYFHIECFRCCMCQMLLGNGMRGTDVQVKNNQLYCSNCFTVD